MSATEKATDAMPDTLDAAELQRRCAAGEIAGCVVQGPLSFDLAYATDAGDKKRIAGSVVGAADAMLFPNLLAANLTVKAIMYNGGVPIRRAARRDLGAGRVHVARGFHGNAHQLAGADAALARSAKGSPGIAIPGSLRKLRVES